MPLLVEEEEKFVRISRPSKRQVNIVVVIVAVAAVEAAISLI